MSLIIPENPSPQTTFEVKKREKKQEVLIIGAGVAGITASLRLAREGINVHLVERESGPGGWGATYGCKAADVCVKCSVCVVEEKIEATLKNPRIRLYCHSTVASLEREDSRFKVRLASDNREAPPPLRADAVLVATGFKPYDAIHRGEYGWKLYPDVITGLEAEQMLPEKGELVKPSDGEAPTKVALIQCVGSRYAQFGGGDTPAYIQTYCSRVCCAYALRMANLLIKRQPPAQVTIFYMDLQNFGKGFSTLLNGCRDKVGFVRTIPSRVEADSAGKTRIIYESIPAGKVVKEDFDLIVLSIGMAPRDDASSLAKMLKLRVDEHGFFEPTHPDDATLTGEEGIFMAGACVSPKTIASSILEAEKAADNILKCLR